MLYTSPIIFVITTVALSLDTAPSEPMSYLHIWTDISYRLALFHSPSGAASCFPTIHPFLSISFWQHDHWNPLEKSSYSINVHASPSMSGSKFSQTSCSELTSRLPVALVKAWLHWIVTRLGTTYQDDGRMLVYRCSRESTRIRSCGTVSLLFA
jgi:hypothetical protein